MHISLIRKSLIYSDQNKISLIENFFSPSLTPVVPPYHIFNHLLVSFIVVRGKELFHPLEAERFEPPGQAGSVGDGESHVAVQHQGEVRTHSVPPLLEELHVFVQPLERYSHVVGNVKWCFSGRLSTV